MSGWISREATLLSVDPSTPKRGEIWLVNLDPTVGAEIKKTRPAVVVSSNALGKLPLRLIAPITEWKEHFDQNFWHVGIAAGSTTGLEKLSVVDALQLRAVDVPKTLYQKGGQSTCQCNGGGCSCHCSSD